MYRGFALLDHSLLCKTITFTVIENRNGDAIIASIFKIMASSMTIVPTSISSEIPTCKQRQTEVLCTGITAKIQCKVM